MKIFALRNIANSGKTSTLKLLAERIEDKYPQAKKAVLATGTVDIKVLIHPVKGQIVGIESQGDPNSRLELSLREFEQRGCDIVFCSCRSSGMTVDWIKAMGTKHSVQFIDQVRAQGDEQQQAANADMFDHLMRLSGI